MLASIGREILELLGEALEEGRRGAKWVEQRLKEVNWGEVCQKIDRSLYRAELALERGEKWAKQFVDRAREAERRVAASPAAQTARHEAMKLWERLPQQYRLLLGGGALVAVPVIGLKYGFGFPDRDIELFGVRWHRFFLFHSAFGAWALKKFFEMYRRHLDARGQKSLLTKLAGGAAAAGAFGIAIHLAKDALLDGGKSVVFGIPGLFGVNTLVPGTSLDDDAFLLANSLWAFKMGRDILVLAFGEDLEKAGQFVRDHLAEFLQGRSFLRA